MLVIGDSDQRPPLDEHVLAVELALTPDLTLELLPESPSTNQVAADRARDGAPDGLLVVADHQTAGRGRLDRTWETPAGAAMARGRPFTIIAAVESRARQPGSTVTVRPWRPSSSMRSVGLRPADAGSTWSVIETSSQG